MSLVSCKSEKYNVYDNMPTKSQSENDNKIAVVMEEPDRSYNIYTIENDGDNLQPLTETVENLNFSNPIWSPDGKKILFQSFNINSPILEDIWIINHDGTQLFNLTKDSGFNALPNWSPDGTQIAFSSEDAGNSEIYVVDVNGSNLKRLTSNPALDVNPIWSPDGHSIAFLSNRAGSLNIYIMKHDGSDINNINKSLENVTNLRWNPNGQVLSYFSDNNLWLIDIDGNDNHSVSDDLVIGFPNPSWSPNGQYLLFTAKSLSDSYTNVYIFDFFTELVTRLTDDKQNYSSGSWSPDGSNVTIFSETNNNAYTLLVLNIDNLNTKSVFEGVGMNCCATWQPDFH